MFSGIVEEIGEVHSLDSGKNMTMWDGSVAAGVELTVKSKVALEEAYLGCSIAVNGVCLTATSLEKDKFSVGLSPETLRRTNLKNLQPGSKVNVERALKSNSRNSGHFVQGHIDTTATIIDKSFEKDSIWYKFAIDPTYIEYIVPKGFIAIDGTSLTVCDVHKPSELRENSFDHLAWFSVMIVPHTQQSVILPLKNNGDAVNIEVDVVGKLIHQSAQVYFEKANIKIEALEVKIQELTKELDLYKLKQ